MMSSTCLCTNARARNFPGFEIGKCPRSIGLPRKPPDNDNDDDNDDNVEDDYDGDDGDEYRP